MGWIVSGFVSAPRISQLILVHTGSDERGAEVVADQELRPNGAHGRPQTHTAQTV
jgi:hypothetical protein